MTEQTILQIFANYEIDTSFFRKNYKAVVAEALVFCEKKGIKVDQPLFSRKGTSGNTYIHYFCECGEKAHSMLSGFTKKTVFACKKCNAAQLNKIFKPINNNVIVKKLNKKGFEVLKTDNEGCLHESSWTLRCSFNHTFDISGANVQRITNCPHCYKSSMEEEVLRNLVEHHFQKEFPNVRPEWLVNPETNQLLELDLFNPEMGLAFEYHGPQHHLPIFGEERLQKSIRNDTARREVCIKNNVQLIEILHPEKRLDKTDFVLYIAEKLKSFNINVSQDSINFAMQTEVQCNKMGKILENIKQRLKDSNKKFVECFYENAYSPISYICNNCKNTHTTSAAKLYSLTKNSCPHCVQLKKSQQAIVRHKKISQQVCKKLNARFVDFLNNKKGHITGFKYEKNGEEFLFGIKKYTKYIQENNLQVK